MPNIMRPQFEIKWGQKEFGPRDTTRLEVSLAEDGKSASLNLGLLQTSGLGKNGDQIELTFGFPRQRPIKMYFVHNSISYEVGGTREVRIGAKSESWKLNRNTFNDTAEATLLSDFINKKGQDCNVKVKFSPNFLDRPLEYINQSESNLQLIVREAHEVGAVVVDDPKNKTLKIGHPYEQPENEGKIFWLDKPLLEVIKLDSSAPEKNKQPGDRSTTNPEEDIEAEDPQSRPVADKNVGLGPSSQEKQDSQRAKNKVKNDITLATEFSLVPRAVTLEPMDWLLLGFEKKLVDWQINSVEFDLVNCRVRLSAGRPAVTEPLIQAQFLNPPDDWLSYYWL